MFPSQDPRQDGGCAVGVATRDVRLLQQIGPVVTRAGCRLVVAHDQAELHQLLASGGYRARVVDLGPGAPGARSPSLCGAPPPGGRGCDEHGLAASVCPMLPPGAEGELVLLLQLSSGVAGGPIALQSYPRHALDQLLIDLGAALPASGTRDPPDLILGEAPAIRTVRDQIRRIARFQEVSVMILGETGTGKEVVAEAIHRLSFGPQAPFVPVNCAAVPRELFESEVFGHEAGAFTGAARRRVGLLEAAAGGTIFLDEIGEMPPSLQPKLLRALEMRRFRRVGSNEDVELSARVVSATNRVPRSPRYGLRPDLHYRLASFTITLPPLRERLEDVPILTGHFLRAFAARHELGTITVAADALERLQAERWPGNVRQLRTVVEHAAILSQGQEVGREVVEVALGQDGAPSLDRPRPPGRQLRVVSSREAPAPAGAGAGTLRDVERQLIVTAWEESGGNVSEAARLVGVPRSTLRAKLKRFGLR